MVTHGSSSGDEPSPHRPRDDPDYPTEILTPSSYPTGRGQVPPARPPDPILPYIASPVPRRRRSDLPVLVLALVVSALIMAGCCIAGFAFYSGRGS